MQGFINILKSVMDYLVNTILEGLLETYLTTIAKELWDKLMNFLGEILYIIYSTLLSFVDFLANLFSIFSGTEVVSYNNGTTKKTMTLLEVFFQIDQVKTAFLLITLLGVGLTFLFTIYKVGKSMSDMVLEDKNPIGKVLKNGLKAALIFAMVPFLCLVILQLCTKMTNGIDTALSQNSISSGNSEITIGTILFLSSSLDAAKETTGQAYNLSDKNSVASFTDSIRNGYYKREKLYTNIKQVGTDFYYARFDYFIGFISALFMVFVLLAAIFQFIRRMFEIVTLYIVSPLFTSTIPLDDGALFGRWRDMFVAKFFSAFGSIFAIKLFLLIVPSIACGNIMFSSNGTLDYILKILLILGGAFSIFKSQHMILQILNPEAAMMDMQGAAFIVGMVSGAASGSAAMAASGAGQVGRLAGGNKSGGSGSK